MKLSAVYSAVVIAGLVSAAPAGSGTKNINSSFPSEAPRNSSFPHLHPNKNPEHVNATITALPEGQGSPSNSLKPTGTTLSVKHEQPNDIFHRPSSSPIPIPDPKPKPKPKLKPIHQPPIRKYKSFTPSDASEPTKAKPHEDCDDLPPHPPPPPPPPHHHHPHHPPPEDFEIATAVDGVDRPRPTDKYGPHGY